MTEGTLPVRTEVDSRGEETGIEAERPSEDGADDFDEPFNPEAIDVVTRSMTIGLLLSRIESGAINLHPDFQRRWGIWDFRRQSRLIESLLLRIPLPTLYAAEDDDEDWEIVDGIQRLSTIARFIKASLIGETSFKLQNLEYLNTLNDCGYDELPPKLQRRIMETELVIHLIRRGTPPRVKHNIFARINTGGMPLSSQELRHALVPGAARAVLEQWASLPEFKTATCESVNPKRMDDRELVLRYIAFRLTPPPKYAKPDMDGFLIEGMRLINGLTESALNQLQGDFKASMNTASEIFGNDAFRKRYDKDDARKPINKALFEALSVNLGVLSVEERALLKARAERVCEGLLQLCLNRDFDRAISQGTGDVGKVRLRFGMVANMLRGVLEHDKAPSA